MATQAPGTSRIGWLGGLATSATLPITCEIVLTDDLPNGPCRDLVLFPRPARNATPKPASPYPERSTWCACSLELACHNLALVRPPLLNVAVGRNARIARRSRVSFLLPPSSISFLLGLPPHKIPSLVSALIPAPCHLPSSAACYLELPSRHQRAVPKLCARARGKSRFITRPPCRATPACRLCIQGPSAALLVGACHTPIPPCGGATGPHFSL